MDLGKPNNAGLDRRIDSLAVVHDSILPHFRFGCQIAVPLQGFEP